MPYRLAIGIDEVVGAALVGAARDGQRSFGAIHAGDDKPCDAVPRIAFIGRCHQISGRDREVLVLNGSVQRRHRREKGRCIAGIEGIGGTDWDCDHPVGHRGADADRSIGTRHQRTRR